MKRANAVRARTRDEIEGIALRLRRELGIADKYVIDIVSLVEFELSRLIHEFTFSVVDDSDLGSEILALAREHPPEIIVRESVYQQATQQQPMARWILAHEIGHLVLQHAGSATRGLNDQIPAHVAAAEYEANVFAQSLLMPSELVEGCSSPSEIAEKFLVSRSAAQRRFREVDNKQIKGAAPSTAGQRANAEIAHADLAVDRRCRYGGFCRDNWIFSMAHGSTKSRP
jgi:Zn-dependent peptidase ImmA (M78 family)